MIDRVLKYFACAVVMAISGFAYGYPAVNCTWTPFGGGGYGGYSTSVDGCLTSQYSVVAVRTISISPSSRTCAIDVATGYVNRGSCDVPKFTYPVMSSGACAASDYNCPERVGRSCSDARGLLEMNYPNWTCYGPVGSSSSSSSSSSSTSASSSSSSSGGVRSLISSGTCSAGDANCPERVGRECGARGGFIEMSNSSWYCYATRR